MITESPTARAVVVSVGAVTAQGPTAAALWDGVRDGRVAIRPVSRLPMDGYRTRIAGEVAEDVPAAGLPDDEIQDRALDFALVAADEAMTGAAAARAAVPAERWAVVLSTCNAGLLSAEHWYQARERGEPADPRLLVYSTPQGLAEAVAGAYQVRGPVHSLNTACAAGANAVGYAAELIRLGRADAVLAGGTDALSDVLISGFNSLESLSPEPAMPYSKHRQGLSLGEGSGMLVLVRAELAGELGLRPLAEVASLALSADGYHPTAPHPTGRGAGRAIREALRAAGVEPEQVDYINSHGTGTAKNDSAETLALKFGLGEVAAKGIAISSTKSMIGHLLGAAGAVESIVTVKAIAEQVAPPTANLHEAASDCDLDYVPLAARPMRIAVAMCNNFAFGGANASLVLTEPGRLDRPAPELDRVLITGVGLLTPGGDNPAELWETVAQGRPMPAGDDGQRVGRLSASAAAELPAKVRRRMDRLGLFSVLAARRALAAAGLDLDELKQEGDAGDRVGVVVGTGIGPMDAMERFSVPVLREGAAAASPAQFPNTVYNAAAGQVAMTLGTVGPTTTLTDGHAAGSAAVHYAADLVALDQADAMLAVGADTLTDAVLAGYRDLGLLAPDSGAEPGHRRGALGLAEAAAALLLERAGVAARRGATPLAEVLGHGAGSDGLGAGRWDPAGGGLERAVRSALDRAGLDPGDIAELWSARSGYRPADRAEQSALGRVFGAAKPAVRMPKVSLGDTIGASTPLAIALAVESWRRGQARGPALVIGNSLGGSYQATVLAPVGRDA